MRAWRCRGGGTRSRLAARRRPAQHIWLRVRGRRVWLPDFIKELLETIQLGMGMELRWKKKVGL